MYLLRLSVFLFLFPCRHAINIVPTAKQLCDELRQYFPFNSVNLFVSYYKHFVPESYLPNSDTFIAKSSSIDVDIDRLRHLATRSIVERKDCIIVASVSAIYGLGLPADYLRSAERLTVDDTLRDGVSGLEQSLGALRYLPAEVESMPPNRGEYRIFRSGDATSVEIGVPWEPDGVYYDVTVIANVITHLGIVRGDGVGGHPAEQLVVYPASHFVASAERTKTAIDQILKEKTRRVEQFMERGAVLEATRLEERVSADTEMLRKVGFCSGIENYSMHMTGRGEGDPPGMLRTFALPFSALAISLFCAPDFGGQYSHGRVLTPVLLSV